MMKRWRNLFVFFIGVAAMAILLSACGGQPHISLADKELDLGDVVNGEVITRQVSVQNDGQAALTIEAVTTSCGCTQATLDPMTIPPGESGTLSIEFDAGAHGPELTGQLIRQVFIASNDPEQSEVVVEIAAHILPPDES